MNSVQHFEIPADDVKRAGTFYAQVFGWATNQFQDDTVLVSTTDSDDSGMPKVPGAINGDISKRSEQLKHPLIVITVESIEQHCEKIIAHGGKKLSEKIEIPEIGYYAFIEDSEGNTIGIWENK